MRNGAIGISMLLGAALFVTGCDQLRLTGGGDAPPDNAAAPQASPGSAGSGLGSSAQCQPPASWAGAAASGDRIRNTLAMDRAGTLTWNGAPIDMVRLRQFLDLTSTMRPAPHLSVEVEAGAPCDRIEAVVTMASRSLNCAADCSYRERGGGGLETRGNGMTADGATNRQ